MAVIHEIRWDIVDFYTSDLNLPINVMLSLLPMSPNKRRTTDRQSSFLVDLLVLCHIISSYYTCICDNFYPFITCYH